MTVPLYKYLDSWHVYSLEENTVSGVITKVSSGSTPQSDKVENWGGIHLWLTPKDITGENNYRFISSSSRSLSDKGFAEIGSYNLPPQTVMLTKRAPVGIPVINKAQMSTNQGFLNFTCGKKILPEFLYYWFKANKKYLDYVSNGSTYDELYPGDLFELIIALPSIIEQENIVSLLNLIEDKIETNMKKINIAKTITEVIFAEWFVNFNFPDENGLPYKSKGGKLIDSDLGLIPEDWVVGEASQLFNLEYGKALQKTKRAGGKIPVYGSSGIVGFHNLSLVKGPGIIVGRKGNVGSVELSKRDFFPIDTTFFVNVNQQDYFYYVYYLLKTTDFHQIGSDSAVPGLNRESVHISKIIIPPIKLVKEYHRVVDSLFELVDKDNNENYCLNSLEKILLPVLISGQVRLK
jgi:type I restriction enzyme S subunit